METGEGSGKGGAGKPEVCWICLNICHFVERFVLNDTFLQNVRSWTDSEVRLLPFGECGEVWLGTMSDVFKGQ